MNSRRTAEEEWINGFISKRERAQKEIQKQKHTRDKESQRIGVNGPMSMNSLEGQSHAISYEADVTLKWGKMELPKMIELMYLWLDVPLKAVHEYNLENCFQCRS